MLHNAQIVGFAEGSHVLMADGSWKTIEKIKEGDMVMSFDPTYADSPLEPRKVTNTWSGIHRECLEVHQNNKVTVTAKDQLFFTPRADWAYCFETKSVVNYDGNTTPIQTRNVRGGKWKIYDITVDTNHSFIVNDMRVHNKKKKPAPQPVVTAGKPGKPVTVTTTTTTKRGGTTTTTVTVQPSPGSSAQVAVSGNGSIGIRQNSVPGLPVDGDYVAYQPAVVLPYPGGSYVYDRALNSEIIRSAVCGDMLSKGVNYRVTKADASSWSSQLNSLLSELQAMKSNRVPMNGNKISIKSDPTAINDAISQAKALKKEIKAGRKISIGMIQQNCDKLAGIIQRIKNSTGLYNYGGGTIYRPIGRYNDDPGYYIDDPGFPGYNGPIYGGPEPYYGGGRGHEGTPVGVPGNSGSGDTTPIEPTPESYYTDRIYENNANYAYIGKLSDTSSGTNCQYIFDPPDGPANTNVRYYKHWDPNSNSYYYDRISSGGTC